jgi:polyferredoxin
MSSTVIPISWNIPWSRAIRKAASLAVSAMRALTVVGVIGVGVAFGAAVVGVVAPVGVVSAAAIVGVGDWVGVATGGTGVGVPVVRPQLARRRLVGAAMPPASTLKKRRRVTIIVALSSCEHFCGLA